jgi:hypothetical protein
MTLKRVRSPQEKKAFSLQRDTRDHYGESNKGSRRLVPLNKAKSNRVVRHAAKQSLMSNGQDESDSVLYAKSKARWRKCAHQPLGEYVAGRLERREDSHRAKIKRREDQAAIRSWFGT